MTVARHPAELELFALVEGELSRGAARAVEAHLGTCAACRGAAEAQRSTRALLRDAPAISPLAAQQVQALVRALPAHPRSAPWWRSRPALVLTPALGLAVAVVAVVLSLSSGTRQSQPTAVEAAPTAAVGAQAGPSAKAAPEATQRAAAVAPDARRGPGSPLASVAGTPAQTVAFLRARGIVATAKDGQVLVREADGPRARAALAILPSGPVRVLVR